MKLHKEMKLKEVMDLTEPCSCDKCNNGCQFGSGAMLDEDIKKLAAYLKLTEKELKDKYLEEIEKFNTKRFRPKILRKDKPYGKCIFFNDGCSIHLAKPTECRIAMNCKEYGEDLITWFTLNYYVNAEDPESVRQWAIFLKVQDAIPGGKLEELVPDKEKLTKILNYEILK